LRFVAFRVASLRSGLSHREIRAKEVDKCNHDGHGKQYVALVQDHVHFPITATVQVTPHNVPNAPAAIPQPLANDGSWMKSNVPAIVVKTPATIPKIAATKFQFI
jgi:hypothetical protein